MPESAASTDDATINSIKPAIGLNARRQRQFKIWVGELALSCCALALLIMIATPLAQDDRPLGLDQRYATSHAATAMALPVDLALNSKLLRAQQLNRHAGALFAVLAVCGLIALHLGRSALGIHVTQALIAALWCVAAHLLGIFSGRWPALWQADALSKMHIWLWAASGFFLIALMAPTVNNKAVKTWRFKHTAASIWVYPGFVLFCGLGWFWLLDWAARGHLDKQFIGIYQLDSLWLAFAILSLVAAHQGQLLAAMSRFASWLDQVNSGPVSMPNGLLLMGLLVWILLVAAAGQIHIAHVTQVKTYQRHAALLAELMRVPVWLALGWILYRWVETGQRASQGMVAAAALLATLMLGLYMDHDGGAMLAQTIAVIWIFCGLMQHLVAQRCGAGAGWLIAISTAALGTAGAIWLAFLQAPHQRIDALALDYQGPLDFLSVIHWMLDAVPMFGFGIGNTPWCGYAQASGLATQCMRAGVPDQIQSDYVTFALVASWGWIATLALLAALLLWLWELMRNASANQTRALNLNLLRQWLVTGFAVTSGVQIAISTAGTLGKMPLTGLAIPMLSFGGACLLSTALFAGLSVNRIDFKEEKPVRRPGQADGNPYAMQKRYALP